MSCRCGCGATIGIAVDDGLSSRCFERFGEWVVQRRGLEVLLAITVDDLAGPTVNFKVPDAQVLFDEWLTAGRPKR